MSKSRTTCRCLVRQYVKGSHCKQWTDEYVLMKCPCPAFPGSSPCKPRKPRPPRRKRKRRKRKIVYPTFVKRYRSKPLAENKPVQVGTLKSWRYGTDVYTSTPRPWYDPTGVTAVRCWDELHPPRKYSKLREWRVSATGVHPSAEGSDFGGPFRLLRMSSPWHEVSGHCHVDNGDPLFNVSYNGGFVPTSFGTHPDPAPVGDFWDSAGLPDFGNATSYGAQAWSRTAPTLREVDLSAAIFELKDLPEQLRTTARGFRDLYHSSMESVGIGVRDGAFGRILEDQVMNPRNLADHFLNHAFGWAPFVNDLLSTYEAVSDFQKRFYQHKRDNGRWVRRRRTIHKSRETSEQLYADHYAYVYPDIAGLTRWDFAPDGTETRGYSRFIHETIVDVWASGTWKYWIPDLVHDDFSTYSNVMNRVRYFGIRVNPSLIWKLTPWSWLGDWFFNIRQFYDIMSAEDQSINLVAKYAYVMQRVLKRTKHFATIFLADGRNAECGWAQTFESKHRARMSPFGISTDVRNLSAHQWAILASLGITRTTLARS